MFSVSEDAMGENAVFGKHKMRFLSLFLMWKCGETVTVGSFSGHTSGCVHAWIRMLQYFWEQSIWTPLTHVALPPWEEVGSEGISAGEVVAGAVSGKYLSICPAQHASRFFEINWTTYLLKIT